MKIDQAKLAFGGAGMLRATSTLIPLMVASAGLNGAVAVVTARSLGAEGRGQLVLVITVAAFTGLLVGCGTNVVARFHLVSARLHLSLSDYLGLIVVLGIIETAVVIPTAAVSLLASGAPLSSAGLLAATLLGPLSMAAVLIRDAVNAYGNTTRAAFFTFLGTFFVFVGAAALSVQGSSSTSSFIYILAAGSAVEITCDLLWLRKGCHQVRPRFNAPVMANLIRRGAPALGLTAGQTLTFRVDRYIMGFILGAGSVGVYAMAATLSELLRLVPTALGQILFYRTASRELSLSALTRARRMTLLIMVPGLCAFAVFAPNLIAVTLGPAFADAVTPLRILLLGEVAIMSFQIDSRVLSGLGAASAGGLAGLLGLASVVVLDLILIPRHGLNGAAVASVISYMIMGLAARLQLTACWAQSEEPLDESQERTLRLRFLRPTLPRLLRGLRSDTRRARSGR